MTPLVARETIGGYATWAAFCDEPSKCFAVGAPIERRGDPFLTIAIVGRDVQVEAHVGREIRAATLQIGSDRFPLTPSHDKAVADVRSSRQIVAAIRAGETMTVFGTSSRGRFRHHYLLSGAPSAIDAAAVAARRR
jgi:hypothetical protein